jgi:hypothetical protein
MANIIARKHIIKSGPTAPDEAALKDILLEENDPVLYYFQNTLFLQNFLAQNLKWKSSKHYTQVEQIIDWFKSDPNSRAQESDSIKDVGIDLVFYGILGRAAYFLCEQGNSQFIKEFDRLVSKNNELIGNTYLFNLSGFLASRNYKIEFIGELGKLSKKTPDFSAEFGNRKVFIEANAKQPGKKPITQVEIDNFIKGILLEKKQKFEDDRFFPGCIAADISGAQLFLDSNGNPKEISVAKEAVIKTPDGIIECHQYKDPTFLTINNGALVSAAKQLADIDSDRYKVTQVLLSMTRQLCIGKKSIEAPQGHCHIIKKDYSQSALQNITRCRYII